MKKEFVLWISNSMGSFEQDIGIRWSKLGASKLMLPGINYLVTE